MSNLFKALEIVKKSTPGWVFALMKQQAEAASEVPAMKAAALSEGAFCRTNAQKAAFRRWGASPQISVQKSYADLGCETLGAFAESVRKGELIQEEQKVAIAQLTEKAVSLGSVWGKTKESPVFLLDMIRDLGFAVGSVKGEEVFVTMSPTITAKVIGYDSGVAALSVQNDEGEWVFFGNRNIDPSMLSETMMVDLDLSTGEVQKSEKIHASTENEVIHKGSQEAAPQFIDVHGAENPKLLLLSFSPNELEAARGRMLVGSNETVFREKYLPALGLSESEVAFGFCAPVCKGEGPEAWAGYLESVVKAHPDAVLVCIGKKARECLKKAGFPCHSLPHPSAYRGKETPWRLESKTKAIRAELDGKQKARQNGNQAQGGDEESSHFVSVRKASQPKRIVYGVVLDPYEVDAHGDWIPPSAVEETAHRFLVESSTIFLQHAEWLENTYVVESFIENYPTSEDYQAAMRNEPHQVSLRKYGSDTIKSGSWVIGVKLSEFAWDLFQQGKLTGFSIGALASVTTVPGVAMPEVEFVGS